ncbi:PREDICTED: uncharacterized protein LOC104704788 [Camelina sativa]|uniref:Uncharacterized protein LOC104704788 n=1 Tax=Camelina sativa TaxID=90675 RepID=A0ABM0T0V9_CAMSA|nr:PREDICTED: uncharacterized protein LOC104704788 [Camelina sativa]
MVIGSSNFLDVNPNTSGSWFWKSLCKLRPLAKPFIVCEVRSGDTCSFWNDNWTFLEPLIEVTGQNGPQTVGLPVNAVVADALRDGDWWISASRSRNPIIQLIKQCLPNPHDILRGGEEDTYLWKIGDSVPSSKFSAAATWRFLNPPGPSIDWHGAVWFKGKIPRHAFIAWIAARHRLHTRDRLISWGLHVPSNCLLCNRFDESLQHIFFDCDFSQEVWSYFTSRANVTSPMVFQDVLRWMNSPARDKNVAFILLLGIRMLPLF